MVKLHCRKYLGQNCSVTKKLEDMWQIFMVGVIFRPSGRKYKCNNSLFSVRRDGNLQLNFATHGRKFTAKFHYFPSVHRYFPSVGRKIAEFNA